MLEELFSGNLVVAILISVIIIASYSNFQENQRTALIYLSFFGLYFYRLISLRVCIVLLLIGTFLFLEYLTSDTKKLELVTSFMNKVIDYFYIMIFQLFFLPFLFSLFFVYLNHVSHGIWKTLTFFCSFGLLIYCEHRVITQPFKIKGFEEMMVPFETNPYYNYVFSEEAKKRYWMLCRFEDHTYYQRKNTYSIVSPEYIKIYGWKRILQKVSKRIYRYTKRNGVHFSSIKKLINRGYSVPEMQLIRTIGVKRGYDKYKFERKIFEVLYSKILFESLKRYQVDNSGSKVVHFRDYILDVYCKTVLIVVNGRRIPRMCMAFEGSQKQNEIHIEKWPMEGMFVVCLGLSQRYTNEYHMSLYSDIIEEFGLDKKKILEYAELVKNGGKIPLIS